MVYKKLFALDGYNTNHANQYLDVCKKEGDTNINILHVNKLYHPSVGGIEEITRQIAEGLKDKTNNNVLCCQAKGPASVSVINGVGVLRAGSVGVFNSMPVSFSFSVLFKIAAEDCDIVQMHMPFPLGDAALFLSRYKGKVVIWWHSDIIRQKKLLFFYKPLLKWMLRRADSIITATQAHIDSSKYLPPYANKCKVIPYGIDFSRFPQGDKKKFLTKKLLRNNNVKLLFVGRLVYYKGIDILVRAMERVAGAELFVVGEGPLENEVKGECIHYLKALTAADLAAAYADCDIFIFPSVANSEAFGLVQLEAMYFGKPVINTRLPTGVPLVSIHEETGLTVEPGDPVSLADAINKLVRDETKRFKYGKNAAKRVRSTYHIETMLTNIYSHYKEVLNK